MKYVRTTYSAGDIYSIPVCDICTGDIKEGEECWEGEDGSLLCTPCFARLESVAEIEGEGDA